MCKTRNTSASQASCECFGFCSRFIRSIGHRPFQPPRPAILPDLTHRTSFFFPTPPNPSPSPFSLPTPPSFHFQLPSRLMGLEEPSVPLCRCPLTERAARATQCLCVLHNAGQRGRADTLSPPQSQQVQVSMAPGKPLQAAILGGSLGWEGGSPLFDRAAGSLRADCGWD